MKNDAVVTPTCTPEPVNNIAFDDVVELFVTEKTLAFDAPVCKNLPAETTMSPFVSVRAAVPRADPVITVAPNLETVNTAATALLSQIFKYLPAVVKFASDAAINNAVPVVREVLVIDVIPVVPPPLPRVVEALSTTERV